MILLEYFPTLTLAICLQTTGGLYVIIRLLLINANLISKFIIYPYRL